MVAVGILIVLFLLGSWLFFIWSMFRLSNMAGDQAEQDEIARMLADEEQDRWSGNQKKGAGN